MNPFRPASTGPSVIHDADPLEYSKQGGGKRGDKSFVMSRTELMRFDANPWEWVHGSEVKETGDMVWGSLLDTMFTTPSLLTKYYDIYPETYPESDKPDAKQKPWNLNANFCKDWRDKRLADGVTPINVEVHEGARQACARLLQDSHIARLQSISLRQVIVRVEYVDKDTEIVVPVKMMIDLVPNPEDKEYGRLLADLKSSNDISIYEWEKNVFFRQYHVQAKMYLDGYNAASGEEHYNGFLHVLSKSEEPYAVGRRILSDEFLELGGSTYKRALARYCQCLKSGFWPGVDDEDVPGSPVLEGWRLCQPASWMI